MKYLNKIILLCVVSVLGLGGCVSDESEVTSGGGGSGVVSDNGANSAVYAGVYSGSLVLSFSSDNIGTRNRNLDATMAVGSDGMARLIIDGDSTTGNLNGNQFGFKVRISDTEDLVKCKGDALINGSIIGNIAQAAVSGSGECEFLTFDDPMTISGSLSVSK